MLSTASRTIRVSQKQYKGGLCVETPGNNQSCLLPDSDRLKITGWAVSDDSNVSLKLYVNDWLWAEIFDRTERGDVDAISKEYGGTKTTPKAGFIKELDISKFQPGKYTIKIEQVSRFGKVLNSVSKTINVSQRQFKGAMLFETPSANTVYYLPNANPTINISGWAVSEDANSYISLYVDGQLGSYTLSRNERGDVDSLISPQYGGTKATPKAGVSIHLDISKLYEGTHVLDIIQVSRYDKIMSRVQIPIRVATPNYPQIMCIDTPVQNKRYTSGTLEIAGWALTENMGDFVDLYIDGRFVGTANRGQRVDVMGVYGNQFGGWSANPTPGFSLKVNTGWLAEGNHTLKATHFSSYRKEIGSAEVTFTISNTKTWGIDVSHHNGAIDWNAVRNQGINFAILKIGEYRESSGRIIVDPSFNTNYYECKRLGIAVGGYFYSYAFNPAEAANEANACLSIINGKSFEMPIFFDIEDHIVTEAIDVKHTTNVENVTNAAITFCDILNSRGYQAGVYSYRNFFYNYLNTPALERYHIWLAHYVPETDYTGRYDIWQYTSTGRIPGINGNVDLNWCFRRYY